MDETLSIILADLYDHVHKIRTNQARENTRIRRGGTGIADMLRDLQMSNRFIANALFFMASKKGAVRYPYPNPVVKPDAADTTKNPLQPLPPL